MKTPVPTIGPTSHPAPAHVNVISPREIKGSRGSWPTRASIFVEAIREAPDTKPKADVVIDELSWKNRLFRRRRKNVFQSRSSVDLLSADSAAEAAESGADDAEDAQRIFGEVGLNVTLRFGKGTLRCAMADEESVDRHVLGVLV